MKVLLNVLRRLFTFPIRKYSCKIVYHLRAILAILFLTLVVLSFGSYVNYYGEHKLFNLTGTCGTINSLINITSTLVLICCSIELVNSTVILIEKPLALKFGERLLGKYADLIVGFILFST
jgi:succinate-acetate transporter protein